jgi:sugar phosphate isomerase/epimerase
MKTVRGIGFSTAVSEEPDFEQLRRNLDEAAALGVGFAELPVFAMDLIAAGRILPTQLRRLKQAVAGRGVGFTLHGPIAVNFMQGPEIIARHLAVAKANVELAAEIGAVHLVLHTGHMPAQSEAAIEAAYAAQREAFAALGEIAAQHSIIIAAENIFARDTKVHTALPSRLAREIEAIGHPNVRGCLDFSHAAITCAAQGADYLAEAGALARVARHLHLHDSFGDPFQLPHITRSERLAYGLGDLHLPLGWGNLPWAEMMASFVFEPDVIFNLELPVPFWSALAESVGAMQDMAQAYQQSRPSA